MIEKICVDTISKKDLDEFIKTGKALSIFTKLEQNNDCYIVGVDIASEQSKDYSCMTYYRREDDGNIVFAGSEIIK